MRNVKIYLKALALGFTLIASSSVSPAQSGAGGSTQTKPAQATPQRPTFTADTSTTAPGTMEIEFGTTFAKGFFATPVNLKFTPEAGRGLFHQTEFSLSFDAVTSLENSSNGNRRITQFGDYLSFVARRPVYQGKQFSLAVAPRAIFFLRGNRGARLGVRGLAAYSFGQNSVVFNATWTSATSSSLANPPQQYDLAADYARTLGSSGFKSKLAVFGGVSYENPSNQPAAISLGQGVSYRVRPNLVFDIAVRQTGLAAGPRDYQILTGFTINAGRVLNR